MFDTADGSRITAEQHDKGKLTAKNGHPAVGDIAIAICYQPCQFANYTGTISTNGGNDKLLRHNLKTQ